MKTSACWPSLSSTQLPEFIFGEKSSKLYLSCLAWPYGNAKPASPDWCQMDGLIGHCQAAAKWYNKKIPTSSVCLLKENPLMSEYTWLALFSVLIAAFALFGG